MSSCLFSFIDSYRFHLHPSPLVVVPILHIPSKTTVDYYITHTVSIHTCIIIITHLAFCYSER